MEWIDAMRHPDSRDPQHILIAGCGTGDEAFAFRRQFPRAEITGVDFSARSIKIALKLRRHVPNATKIRFVRADLINDRLSKIAGTGFDFISCHGVLSYIPGPERAIANLAECLALKGALFLGVNGREHFSEKWRQTLPQFGFDLNRFADDPHLRRILKLHDALTEHPSAVARQGAEYLASDLFGPMTSNRPLAYWTKLCRRSGLHFTGSYVAHRSLRPVLNSNLYDLFIPRSRAEVHEVVEQIQPASFHYLVFKRQRGRNPPWLDPELLKDCRVSVTKIYSQRWPTHRNGWLALRDLTLKSKPTNTVVDLRSPEWMIEILRQRNVGKSVGEVLDETDAAISDRSIRKHLYLLYLLALINLTAPE
jgi:SAM-dependent methyltransferase